MTQLGVVKSARRRTTPKETANARSSKSITPVWRRSSKLITQYEKRMSTDLDREQYPKSMRKLLVTRAIDIETARGFIERYEYLGDLGAPKAAYGTFTPDGELLNVECFGVVPGQIAKYLGVPSGQVICLERGASRRIAPEHTAQKAITDSIVLAAAEYGWSVFVAYADPSAGESGRVYKQDHRWYYLGRNVGRKGGRWRFNCLKPGTWCEIEPGVIESDMAPGQSKLFRGKGLNFKTARAAGWAIVKVETKHVFVRFAGPVPPVKAGVRLISDRELWPRRINEE